jgi:hypothetical protein
MKQPNTRRDTIEAEVRSKFAAELAATSDYWKLQDLEDKIRNETEHRLTIEREAIEAEVRSDYQAELLATSDYWKLQDLEDKIGKEANRRLASQPAEGDGKSHAIQPAPKSGSESNPGATPAPDRHEKLSAHFVPKELERDHGITLTECSNCRRRVIPTTNDCCPSCLQPLTDSATTSVHPPPSSAAALHDQQRSTATPVPTPPSKRRLLTLIVLPTAACLLVALFLLDRLTVSKPLPPAYKLQNAFQLMVIDNGQDRSDFLFAPPIRGFTMAGGDVESIQDTNPVPYVVYFRNLNNLEPPLSQAVKRYRLRPGVAYLAFDTEKEMIFTPMKDFDLRLTDAQLKEQVREYMLREIRSKTDPTPTKPPRPILPSRSL